MTIKFGKIEVALDDWWHWRAVCEVDHKKTLSVTTQMQYV